jgi:hypothetical protein
LQWLFLRKLMLTDLLCCLQPMKLIEEDLKRYGLNKDEMLVIFSYLQWFMSEFYLVWSIWKEGNGIGPIYVHLTWGLVCLLFLLLSIPLYQTWNRKISFGKNYILEYLYRVCLHGVTMHKSDHESNGGSKVTSLRNYLTTYIYPGSGWSETAVLIKLPLDPVKKSFMSYLHILWMSE